VGQTIPKRTTSEVFCGQSQASPHAFVCSQDDPGWGHQEQCLWKMVGELQKAFGIRGAAFILL
jgi:hypothetical protein